MSSTVSTSTKAKTGSIRGRVESFHKSFYDGLANIDKKIKLAETSLQEKMMEVKYVREVELPKALEIKYVSGDEKEAKKFTTLAEKLSTEISELQEELVVMANVRKRYIASRALDSKALVEPFNKERDSNAKAVYHRLSVAKRKYLEALQEEAKLLHEYYAVDLKLAEVMREGGQTKPLTYLPLLSAKRHQDKAYHEDIYLGVTAEEVERFLKRVDTPEDINYLPNK